MSETDTYLCIFDKIFFCRYTIRFLIQKLSGHVIAAGGRPGLKVEGFSTETEQWSNDYPDFPFSSSTE